MIAAAIGWAGRGFAVFPLMPRGKVPLGALAPHGLKDASRDRGIIADWWRREPSANIGLRTGGGFFVIDLDGPDAVKWFANAKAPRTLTVKTRSGFHLFFSTTVSVPNSAGRIAPGVDVRGQGGYVVAPPSVHPAGDLYTIARDLPIAAPSRWLVEAAMPDEGSVPAPAPMPTWRSEDAKLRAIPSILSLLANAREGERNRITFWAACRFNEMVRDGLITQGLAEELLLQGARRCGLAGREILTTARSASKQASR